MEKTGTNVSEQSMSNNQKRGPLVADKRYSKTAPVKKRATKRKPAKRKPSRGPIGWLVAAIMAAIGFVLRLIWKLMWRGAVVMGVILGIGIYYFASQMQPIDTLIDGRARGSVTMTDGAGAVYAWRGDQFGGMITTDTVSSHLKNAVVASEDKRFYRHFGISPRGIASAVRIN